MLDSVTNGQVQIYYLVVGAIALLGLVGFGHWVIERLRGRDKS